MFSVENKQPPLRIEMSMRPKENPHIYGTRAAEWQKFHDRWQAKRDAPYVPKPSPAPRVPQQTYSPQASSPQANSLREHRQRSRSSPKGAITIVGLIVGFIAAVYAASHGVKSTLGLACAFSFSAVPVVALLKKLTKS
jgi:hypothetical protein